MHQLHVLHCKLPFGNLTFRRCWESQFCFCLHFSMYWTSALLSKAFNHVEMQRGLRICLNALLIHIFCVQKYVYILFRKQIQTQDTDNIKEDVAEILSAIVYLWRVHQHCIYLFWPTGLKYTHCVQKNFIEIQCMKNNFTLPRSMNYIRVTRTGWGKERSSPTPCGYLLTLSNVRMTRWGYRTSKPGTWKGDKTQKRVLRRNLNVIAKNKTSVGWQGYPTLIYGVLLKSATCQSVLETGYSGFSCHRSLSEQYLWEWDGDFDLISNL